MREAFADAIERYGRPLPPQANEILRGQEAAEQSLLQAIHAQRMPHAWLLTGPAGVGKATLAFRVARFLLTRGKRPGGGDSALLLPDASDEPGLFTPLASSVGRRIASGGHADLLTVQRRWDERRGQRRAGIVVEDVRAVGRFLEATPAEGGWRIVVIDEADTMNTAAANALLKNLEEPPEHALLLLVTDKPGLLPATVRSRCRRLALQPLADGVLAQLLDLYVPELGAEDKAAVLPLAEGSIGRAILLAEAGGQGIARELDALLDSPANRRDPLSLFGLVDRLAAKGAADADEIVFDLVRRHLAQRVRQAAHGDKTDDPVAARARAASLDRSLRMWDNLSPLLLRTDALHLDRRQVLLTVLVSLEAARQ